MAVRVLIVDDHSVVRQGLKTFLSLDPELEVVGAARNGKEALELVEELKPDVVLMDLQMPEYDGFEAIKELRYRDAKLPILALTSALEAVAIVQALKAGANGYLIKNMEGEDLCRAIKSAAGSQIVLSPEAAILLTQIHTNHLTTPTQAKTIREPVMPLARGTNELLTERENTVLQLLAEGLTNKEIAFRMGLSDKTIKVHVSIVMAKLNAQSRTQAALQAVRLGLVSAMNEIETTNA